MKNNETKENVCGDVKKKSRCNSFRKIAIAVFFVAVWAVLAFWDGDTLFRAGEQSLFLYKMQFFKESMALPAGFLSYLGAFFVQFFYYPVLGAAIYVALLALLYKLTKKVFDIPGRWSLLALLPVVFVLATDTQLGYWIFYIKIQGFYYMALLGTIISLCAVWLGYKMRPAMRGLFMIVWTFLTFPLFGVYSLGAAAVMSISALVDSIKARRGILFGFITFVVGASALYSVPLYYYYKVYPTMAVEHIPFAGVPITQWITYSKETFPDGIMEYWVPFILLFVVYMLFPLFKGSFAAESKDCKARCIAVQAVMLVVMLSFVWIYWYKDNNFRIENMQSRAMWNEDWEAVAEYAKDTDLPTRQIVMNKNMALLKLGRALDEAFKYPDGSAVIAHPGVVHLTQTGGMMTYYQYGKFNFSYRWCIENSVEYGWRNEYLKHALRTQLLSGNHKLASRYVEILKHTLFYRSFAEKAEWLIEHPEKISEQKEYNMPLLMYTYNDALELDDSYVEVYVSNSLTNTFTQNDSRLYTEAAVLQAMVRKDVKLFWSTMSRYLSKGRINRVPLHIQEAVVLFTNLSQDVKTNIPIDEIVNLRFKNFLSKTRQYKGMKEKEMAPYFEEFRNTYWYFYFFVREIKTN